MLPVFENQCLLDQIYYDHPYAFSEVRHKDAIKNYFMKPHFQNLRTSATDTNEFVDVEADVDSFEFLIDGHTAFKYWSDIILKALFGANFESRNNNDLKFDSQGIDMNEKAKFIPWYKFDDWTISEVNLRSRLFNILEDGYGSLIIGSGNGSLACFNAAIRKISKRINNAYGAAHWRMDICSCVHAYALEHLSDDLLVIYIECLKHLFQKSKIKTILEQLNNWAQTHKILQRFPWSTVLDICHRPVKEERIDSSQLQWPLEPKLKPIIIHIYPERWAESTRMISFSSKLKSFANVSEFRFDDSGRLRKKFDTLRTLLQSELKSKKGPIFVMGWDLGALLGLLSSIKIHGLSATHLSGVVCLGLPLRGLKGDRGIIPEDYIHLLSKETLLVSGDMAGTGSGDDVEDFKDRMRGRAAIRHVNLGGCDHLLRLSQGYALRGNLTQAVVDRTVLNEVRAFVVDQVAFLGREGAEDRLDDRHGAYRSMWSHTA